MCFVIENPCVLYCVNDEGAIAALKPRVADGTTCYRGMKDVCINGLCQVSHINTTY